MKKIPYISLALLAAALTGCQKDLCYDHHHDNPIIRSSVNVRFDWSAVPEADPAEMNLMIFAEGAQPVQIPFIGKTGGGVSLAPDNYQFIGYNSDNELFSSGRTWAEFEISSPTTKMTEVSQMFVSTRTVPLSRGTEDQPMVYEAEELWTSAVQLVKVDDAQWGQTVNMPMRAATTVFTFRITNVDNLSYVKYLAASLSGMSGTWYPAEERLSQVACIIPFPMEKEDESTITGYLRTFGHCPDPATPHEHHLVVYAEMENQAKYYYTLDVTEKMHEQWDGGDIIIDGLPFPQPISNGSGFQPGVDEWNEVHIDIDLRD